LWKQKICSNDRTAHKEKTCHKCTEQILYMHAPRRHLNEWTKKFFWRAQIWLGCFVLHRYRLETECARCRRSGVGCIKFIYTKRAQYECVLIYIVLLAVVYTQSGKHTILSIHIQNHFVYIKVWYIFLFFMQTRIRRWQLAITSHINKVVLSNRLYKFVPFLRVERISVS